MTLVRKRSAAAGEFEQQEFEQRLRQTWMDREHDGIRQPDGRPPRGLRAETTGEIAEISARHYDHRGSAVAARSKYSSEILNLESPGIWSATIRQKRCGA